MSAPPLNGIRRGSRDLNENDISSNKPLFPTPPPGSKPSSGTRRPGSSRISRPASTNSSKNSTANSTPPISRQSSLVSPTTNELCYEYLPDVTKPATTIGRYHTIVPPINHQAVRPASRSNTVMNETEINLKDEVFFRSDISHEDHAIHSVTEENDPASPRLANPTATIVQEPSQPTLPDEPGEGEPRLKLAVKLSNGKKIERYFSPANHLQQVVDFASTKADHSLSGYGLRFMNEQYWNLKVSLADSKVADRSLLYLLEPP